jgi:hypothetical protein
MHVGLEAVAQPCPRRGVAVCGSRAAARHVKPYEVVEIPGRQAARAQHPREIPRSIGRPNDGLVIAHGDGLGDAPWP